MSPRAAWNVYWILFGVFVVVFAGFVLARGSGIVWGLALFAPMVAAGANLMTQSHSHERVCAIEVERHSWLRALTGGGYTARAFFWTGALEVAFAAALLVWAALR